MSYQKKKVSNNGLLKKKLITVGYQKMSIMVGYQKNQL
jgi:hypothetical protein